MGSDRFSIAEAIRGQVGEASIAAMDAAAPLTAERTIENITEEIIRLKTDAGNAILGIGQRLLEAKAKLQHGEWTAWLAEQVDFSERIAQQYMQLYQGYAANPNALSDLGKTKALKLLSMPREERDEFMQSHDVPNMSTRELKDAIRERDEARKRAEALSDLVKTLEAHNTDLETRALDYSNENDDLKARVKELESAPKEVYRDENAIQKAADEARQKAIDEERRKSAELLDRNRKEHRNILAREQKARRDAEKEIELLQAELAGAKHAAQNAQSSGKASSAKTESIGNRRICDFLCAEIADSANRLYGVLLKNVNVDEDMSDYIRKLFIMLRDKLDNFSKFGARNSA